MKQEERVVLEAVKSMLNQKAKLGLAGHENLDDSHSSQDRWESISEAFKLKIVESPFFESISSAFRQTHDYKYICNPTFKEAFERELRNRGIPHIEIKKAIAAVDSIVESLTKEPCESAAGWNPAIADIAEMTREADSRKPEKSDPPSGGGPVPESVEHLKFVNTFTALKESKKSWREVYPQMAKLVAEARANGAYTVSNSAKLFIEHKNQEIANKIV